jgi:hypothetical protein
VVVVAVVAVAATAGTDGTTEAMAGRGRGGAVNKRRQERVLEHQN